MQFAAMQHLQKTLVYSAVMEVTQPHAVEKVHATYSVAIATVVVNKDIEECVQVTNISDQFVICVSIRSRTEMALQNFVCECAKFSDDDVRSPHFSRTN